MSGLNILNAFTEKESIALISYIKNISLIPDPYFKYREIAWINKVPRDLYDKPVSIIDDLLLEEIVRIKVPWLNYLMISHCTINSGQPWHIDHDALNPTSSVINLSLSKFGYIYNEIEEWVQIDPGKMVIFNNRNKHAAVPLTKDRYTLHCWE